MGFDGIWLDLNGFEWIWMDFTGFYGIWRDLTGFDGIWRDLTGLTLIVTRSPCNGAMNGAMTKKPRAYLVSCFTLACTLFIMHSVNYSLQLCVRHFRCVAHWLKWRNIRSFRHNFYCRCMYAVFINDVTRADVIALISLGLDWEFNYQ